MPYTRARVEDGIPIPKQHKGEKYPFSILQVGQSFFEPSNYANRRKLQNRLSGKERYHPGKKFTLRICGPDVPNTGEQYGVRVWRVK